MVDDFMVCVDRLMASPDCLVNGGREADNNALLMTRSGADGDGGAFSVKGCDGEEGCCSEKEVADMVECRICQEEDEEDALEAPCACNGTLKFAHRKCIQRWCNKKGDTICEICNQVFSPNYSVPPTSGNPDVMAIDIRHAWAQQINLRDSQLLALAVAERRFLESEYVDYAGANTRSMACFRSIALILLIVMLLHQALMATRDSAMVKGSSSFFYLQVSLVQLAGFLLPFYVIACSLYILHSRRRRHG